MDWIKISAYRTKRQLTLRMGEKGYNGTSWTSEKILSKQLKHNSTEKAYKKIKKIIKKACRAAWVEEMTKQTAYSPAFGKGKTYKIRLENWDPMGENAPGGNFPSVINFAILKPKEFGKYQPKAKTGPMEFVWDSSF